MDDLYLNKLLHWETQNEKFFYTIVPSTIGASLIAQLVKDPPAMQETLGWFLSQEDPLEKG